MRRPTEDEWRQITALFDDLADLPPQERDRRLAGGKADPFIIEQTRSLLDAARTEGILDRALPEEEDPAAGYSSLSPGARLGAFEIVRLIGRGGQGEVYEARRVDGGFDQKVALKLLRPETAHKTSLFDFERQILASLEHPGIARLIDGGLAPDGRPYMAMEYVEGRDLLSYAGQTSADLNARLELFLQACDATAYAHQRLVVHRDLKPSNVMVDAAGRVRLLDFGIARIIAADAASDQTGTQALLTPEYAAPELLDNRAPTTAADTYSMGVLLYALLTGEGPWKAAGLSVSTVLKRMLQDDPPPPSQAAARAKDAPFPATRLKGDLDAIAMKALRRRPEDRYDSVTALAEDVRRYLASRVVLARSGSGLYAAGRFIRRNRWAVAAASAAVVVLLAGTGGVLWQARQTTIQRDAARAQAERAEAVNEYVSLMFRDAQESGQGGDISARQLLDSSARNLLRQIKPGEKNNDAVVLAVAELYIQLEDVQGAATLLDQALKAGAGRNDPAAQARLKLNLATALVSTGDLPRARSLLKETAVVWATNPTRFTRERLEQGGAEAHILRQTGDRAAAVALLKAQMPEAVAFYGPGSRELITRYNNLSVHLLELGQVDEAQALLDEGYRSLAATGKLKSIQAIYIQRGQAMVAIGRGDLVGAAELFRKVVEVRRDSFGESLGLAQDEFQLATVLTGLQKPTEALVLLDDARRIARTAAGETSQAYVLMTLQRGMVLNLLGRPEEALQQVAEVEATVRTYPDTIPHVGVAYVVKGWALLRLGKLAEARVALDRAEVALKAAGPAGQGPYGTYVQLRAVLEQKEAGKR